MGFRIDEGTIRGFVFPAGVPKETATMMEGVLKRAYDSQRTCDEAAADYAALRIECLLGSQTAL